MAWTVEVTEEFEEWWNRLDEEQRVSIDGMIRVLEARGPSLGSPFSQPVSSARYEIHQLRVPHGATAICVLFALDVSRLVSVLLIGSTQGHGDNLCPAEDLGAAEEIYGRYLERLGDSR